LGRGLCATCQVVEQFDVAFVVEEMHHDAMASAAAQIGIEAFNHTNEAKASARKRTLMSVCVYSINRAWFIGPRFVRTLRAL